MADTITLFMGGFFCLVATLAIFLLLDFIKSRFETKSEFKISRKRRISDSWETLKLKDETIIECENEETDEFIRGDEFRTQVQECLVVVLKNESHVVGVCAFLNDRKVEYFLERLPECCSKNAPSDGVKDEYLRAVMAGVSHWAGKWCYAEAVSLLCQDRNVVKCV